MPSLGDVANDIKAILQNIETSTAGTRNNTTSIDNHVTQLITTNQNGFNDVVNSVHQLTTTNQAGFTNLAQGLAVQIQLQLQANALHKLNAEQNETIICWLHNIADVLCDIKRNTDKQVDLQRQIDQTLDHLNRILELVHSRETVEVNRLEETEAKIKECCPDDAILVVPCFTDCVSPRVPDFKPVPVKWKPVKFDSTHDPIN